MKLGEKIKLLRTEQAMTQPTLADKAGIEQSYLSKLENDKGSPSFDIINRIAGALGTTGMDLVNSLSRSYIEDHLAHIPEVAAEYESIQSRHEFSQKRRFLIASALIVLGFGLIAAGILNAFYPEGFTLAYVSEGVIRPGEPDYLFDTGHRIPDVVRETETGEEYEARLELIKGRLELHTFIAYEMLGDYLIREVEGGRRKYHVDGGTDLSRRRQNDAITSIGIMLVIAGLMGIAYSIRFKPR